MVSMARMSDEAVVKVTSKGQVFLSKALREKAGITPGGSVAVRSNDQGEVVLRAVPGHVETPDERGARIKAALEALRGKYPNTDGRSTDEYMRWLRGDHQP